MAEFVAWPKTPRWNRDIVITEKIDGTNAAILIEEHPAYDEQDPELIGVYHRWDENVEYHVFAQSRKRMITPKDDNAGFARWVEDNIATLVEDLGTGRHFGEWWGQGIQRKYGMDRKVFSLFNTSKWTGVGVTTPNLDVVPVLYEGRLIYNDGWYEHSTIGITLNQLDTWGSVATEKYGVKFDNPEGVCIFHTAANQVFKATLENDDEPKSLSAS